MSSGESEITHEFHPYFRAYKDGRVERFFGSNIIPASIDSQDCVSSKDVTIVTETSYEDSWAALKWVASHSSAEGPEAWLKDYADFQRVFLVGDSAGGNIVHNMAVQAASEDLSGVKLLGICLIQPFFGRTDGHVDKYWLFVCPTSSFNDPRINPAVDSRLSRLACSRVLIFLAEKDNLRERGMFYCETLKSSGWGRELVIVETEGEDHAFQLFNPNSERALALMNRLVSFINQDKDASM
ncbi:hypothetical protein REPUB_Repub01dG0183600 [Reevesia pubescens]